MPNKQYSNQVASQVGAVTTTVIDTVPAQTIDVADSGPSGLHIKRIDLSTDSAAAIDVRIQRYPGGNAGAAVDILRREVSASTPVVEVGGDEPAGDAAEATRDLAEALAPTDQLVIVLPATAAVQHVDYDISADLA